jgi:hypothetical protein
LFCTFLSLTCSESSSMSSPSSRACENRLKKKNVFFFDWETYHCPSVIT